MQVDGIAILDDYTPWVKLILMTITYDVIVIKINGMVQYAIVDNTWGMELICGAYFHTFILSIS